jgi:hypothetical protein
MPSLTTVIVPKRTLAAVGVNVIINVHAFDAAIEPVQLDEAMENCAGSLEKTVEI